MASQGHNDLQRYLAREFEEAGIASYNKVIDAFARRDITTINVWRRELKNQGKTASIPTNQPSPIVAYLRSVKWTR